MVDLCVEGDNRRLEGIVAGKADSQMKDAAGEGRVAGAEYHGVPGEEVGV